MTREPIQDEIRGAVSALIWFAAAIVVSGVAVFAFGGLW